MKFSVVAAALASTSAVYGHAKFQYAWKNGVDLGAGIGSYIRGPASNSPVKNVKSSDIICNTNNSPVPKTIEVSAGDVLTLEWQHDNRRDDIIDPTHQGPVLVYVAPTASNGQGAVWHKIFDQGFSGGNWATDKLIAAKGTVSITVPNLAAGEYLIRPEIIALHEADTDFAVNPARGAQFYMGCMQIKVVSSGSVKLSSGINFQTDYKSDGTGILFNVYGTPGSSYVSPGGPVESFAVAGAGIGPVPAAGSKPSTTPPAPATTTRPATTTKPASSALPTSRMTTVTIRSSTTAPVPTNPSVAAVAKYGQCGGIGYTGSK
ncbi:glycoside hydrolase family 61 protein [Ceratobasidium sp. AG-Ba]|nr:glycoside hydrolase family 61 protein [Ceratobasidium sp. AG-Ba]